MPPVGLKVDTQALGKNGDVMLVIRTCGWGSMKNHYSSAYSPGTVQHTLTVKRSYYHSLGDSSLTDG